ncbi:DUF4395 domain-containing protein [Sinomonas sp. JGH33]|uniref:DUF4395 domain-containing protein n=1 Tax=Sinomonas terricola TaxID=3110330 RepID=A0ABU5T8W8_9MICC|nr:DUF4395 domain-containing protein [Sinomonas sp. JGH33]MEA5456138.1 DUF4395 domain-containing protein [Sinomonas sp. JGH33]
MTSTRSASAVVRSSVLRRAFAFPNPVNEYAARSTAGIVVVLSLSALVLGVFAGWGWPLWIIALGFWLRVAGGPRYSPAGRLAVHVIAPRFGKPRLVPGPPKRFAQTIGAVLSTAAAILWIAGVAPVALALVGLLVVAASLEAFAGFCLGCWLFGRLQAVGLIPESVCEACSNIALRSR